MSEPLTPEEEERIRGGVIYGISPFANRDEMGRIFLALDAERTARREAERERDEARADLAAAWTPSDAAHMEALVQRDEARARVAELEGAIREYVAGTIPHNEAGARALFRLRGALDTGDDHGE